MAMAQELEKAEEQQQVAQHMEDEEDEDELGDEAFEGVELGDDEEAIEDGDGEDEEKTEGEDGDGDGEEKVADGDAAADLKKPDAAEAAEEAKLFIGGITRKTTTEMLTNHFKKYGELTDSVIMKERDSGRPRGFGFVTYADSSVLDKVLQETHVIDGKSVDVKRTVPRDKITLGPKTKKIFVGGLLPSTTAGDLKDYFSKFGKVEEHQIMHYHSSGKSRGFGFVTFESEQSVEDVILNGKMHEIGGKQVEIKKAEPKKTAQDSGPIRGPLLKGQGGPRRGGYGAGMSRGGGGGGPLRGGRDGGRPVSYGGFGGYGGGMHGYGAGGYRGGSYGGTGPMAPIGYGGGGYGMGGGGYGEFGGYGAMGYGGYAAAGDYGGGGSGYGAGNVGGGGRRNAGNGRYNPYGR